MPLITVDGQQIEVEPNVSIIQAADRLGVEIARFCYHPDLRPEGNCRICLVEVEGFSRLAVACATPVTDGMVVRTPHQSTLAKEAVAGVLEFLLLNHPLDCPICDQAGECSLQDFYMHPDYGLHSSRVDPDEKVRKRKRIDLGPRLVLDSERCVMCSRCVRFSQDVSGLSELQFVHRGNHVELIAFADQALKDPYAGNLADLCPVGALTSRDFRFRRRVWHLAHTDSVCAGCSTGCNLRIDHFSGQIERLVPRRNPELNRSWLCDEGRLSFLALQGDRRLLHPTAQDGAALDWPKAIAQAADLLVPDGLDGPASVLGLASASATNEGLLLFRRLIGHFPEHRIDFRLGQETELLSARQDHLLRRLDKHPNTQGALFLGLGSAAGGLASVLAKAEQGAFHSLLLIYLPPLVGEESEVVVEQLQRLISSVPRSVVLTTDQLVCLNGASLLLPIAGWAEETGTYTNYQGTVQYAEAAICPPGSARAVTAVLADVFEALTGQRTATDAQTLFGQLVETVPAYRGLAWSTLSSRLACAYPPEGRMHYGEEGFAGR